MCGAIAPDADLLYFYLVDHRQHHHHSYLTHFPVLWLALLLAAFVWMLSTSARRWAALTVAFALNGLLHMVLDTVVGDIWWFAPFTDKPYAFFAVPDIYKPWWLNFVLHWSFALELILVLYAMRMWRSTR